MLFKKDELKILWPFYLDIFISGLSTMVRPFAVIYYLSLNFSFFQISVIDAAYAISMVLFEIPTGSFADGFSRKYSVILGLVLVMVSVFIIPLTDSFFVIMCVWVLAGLGTTFISGAQEAWVIDNLNKEGRSDLQHEYFVKISSFSSLGGVIAPLIAVLLLQFYSIKLLWFIFAFGFFISAVVLLLFSKENFKPEKHRPIALIKKSYQNSKLGLGFSIRNKAFFYFMIAGIFIEMINISIIGMNPFLVSLGLAEYKLGYLFSIIAGINMISPFLSKIWVKSNPITVISVIITLIIVLHLSLLLVKPTFVIAACVIFGLLSGLTIMIGPILQTYLHKIIPGKIRATTVSVKSMVTQLAIALSTIGVGALLDIFGPQKVIAYGGLFGVLAMFFYRKVKIDNPIQI
ncbi:MAG TPA: MFS transporter [Flavobacterium sp.]|nr:MFS transporter [Flavobacterium sp.]